ncbi:hypothetical protein [Paenarthrobacter sp. 4246]|uniref:hypothetical protein n=1 Tax=Paenarthrobacter sp. 4246 TaxID=3156456 RepID=UPI003397F383
MITLQLTQPDSEVMSSIAVAIFVTSAAIGLAGFVWGFLQQTVLRSEASKSAWKFYPRLRNRYGARIAPFMPRTIRDQREIVLDLKLNTSLAFATCVFGLTTAFAWYVLLGLAWQFSELQNWNGFESAVAFSAVLGVLAAVLTYAIQVTVSRRRRLLRAAMAVAQGARNYGPASSGADQRSLVSSGQAFLAAAIDLGISPENPRIAKVMRHLSDEGRKRHSRVNKNLVNQVTKVVCEVYSGDHAMTMRRGIGDVIPSKVQRWFTAVSSSAIVVATLNWVLSLIKPVP